MNPVFIALIYFIPPLISSVGVYFIMRRKRKAEAIGIELGNVEKAVSIWRELSSGLEEKVKDLELKIIDIQETQKKKCENCKYRKFYNESQNKD